MNFNYLIIKVAGKNEWCEVESILFQNNYNWKFPTITKHQGYRDWCWIKTNDSTIYMTDLTVGENANWPPNKGYKYISGKNFLRKNKLEKLNGN